VNLKKDFIISTAKIIHRRLQVPVSGMPSAAEYRIRSSGLVDDGIFYGIMQKKSVRKKQSFRWGERGVSGKPFIFVFLEKALPFNGVSCFF
jgi:hypothetical protein